MDDLISDFIVESNESLAVIDNDLVKLEQDPNDKALIGNIFRLMHTIKGTCGFLGLPRLESVAHAAENVMGRFRDGDLEVKPEFVTLIFESIDQVRFLLDSIEETGGEPDGDDKELIAKLDAVFEKGELPGAAPAPAEEESAGATDDDELQRLFDEAEDLTGLAENKGTPASEQQAAEAEAAPVAEETPAPPAKTETKASAPAKKDATPAAPKEKVEVAQSIRVNVDVLEDLMTMVSELVLTRNQLLQILRTQKESEFTAPLQRLNHVVSDLQEGVMKTRMQPIGNAWAKLPRIIRDLSIDLKKKIDLDMRGQDTELDRQVLDLIKDPLTHMVRNSGDHGIETPEERLAAGKPETGTIILEAFHEGGHIIIQIKDDGKGLNTDRIKEKILENGLATADELAEMSDKQIHMHIFAAGFSTAAAVTSVSGRGVGMDVVRTNIEKIGGTIDLESVEGKGSTFTIKIPLTLAIVSALIVESGGERFAIPQLSVQELVMTSSDNQVEKIKGTPVFRLRDRLLPLVTLSDLLKLNTIHIPQDAPTEAESSTDTDVISLDVAREEKQAEQEAAQKSDYIIVTTVGSYSFGIIVDKVFDTEEIVVKPVAQILKGIDIFSGNTILGDGSVIMILDPAGIARATGKSNMSEDKADDLRAKEEAARMRRESEKTSLLLFSAGGQQSPKAVPLSLVARLEEFELGKIEHTEGRMIIQYRNELMSLIPYSDNFSLEGRKSVDTLVFSDETTGSSMGILVDSIIDIVEDRIDIKVTAQGEGLLGSAVIQGKATDIIDVSHWLSKGKTKWFGDHGDQAFKAIEDASESTGNRRILLVDDSPFFRNMLTPLLTVAGYDVTTADNPVQALKLCEDGAEFDVIVSDIEMPEMDGFAFAEKVKSDTSWKNTPMVALSSHATAKDVDQGFQKGFAGYVSKHDRDSILSTISETLTMSESMQGE